MALFAAANEPGIGRVSDVPDYVSIYNPSVLPGGLDASPAGKELAIADSIGAADFMVRIPKAVKSVFRARVDANGIPCCDIIQIWLDTADESSRGIEQADLIWKHYLRTALGLSDYE